MCDRGTWVSLVIVVGWWCHGRLCFLEFKGDGDVVGVVKELMCVREVAAVLEESDIIYADNFCSAFLWFGDIELFAWAHCVDPGCAYELTEGALSFGLCLCLDYVFDEEALDCCFLFWGGVVIFSTPQGFRVEIVKIFSLCQGVVMVSRLPGRLVPYPYCQRYRGLLLKPRFDKPR